MQDTSLTYNSIYESGSYVVQYKVVMNDDTTFYEDSIIDGEITEMLFSSFGIGYCISRMLKLQFIPNISIPWGAVFKVYFRLYSSELLYSEWIKKGTFYTDKRATDTDGVTEVIAYDAMLKGNAVFMETGTWSQTYSYSLYQELAGLIGVDTDPYTLTLMQNTKPYVISASPSIGASGTTIAEMLSYLAVMYGGNFTVTEDDKLKLVFYPTTFDSGKTSSLSVSNAVAVDRIRIYESSTSYIRYPDVDDATWDAMTGRIIDAKSPYVNLEIIEDIADVLIGLNYVGYTALDVINNPATQLGDGIELADHELAIINRVIFFVGGSECSAPQDDELESEYPVINPVERIVAESESRTSARIDVLDDSIKAEVKRATEAEGGISETLGTRITQTASEVRVDLQTYANTAVSNHAVEQQRYIRYNANGLELGEEGSMAQARLTNTKLSFRDANGAEKAYIGQDPNDNNAYKFFVINGHIVNQLELGDHWLLIASGSENDYRLTFKWKA